VAHRLGPVLANAGIDQSNIQHRQDGDRVLLLPEDPDRSAEELRRRLEEASGARVGVVINDSLGRAWRLGTVGIAIGAAGIPCLVDLRGRPDLFGRPLQVSEEAVADELAAAASLLQGQGAEGRPAVLVRGFSIAAPSQPARHLVRPREEDLFR
jgi:coenzyme F420-0:L-glutamate ligase/coenzyme F420-1:gamma-L-glutamate ligase